MFSQTGTDVLPRMDDGLDKPIATIEPHRIRVPLGLEPRRPDCKSDVVAIIYYRGTWLAIDVNRRRSFVISVKLKNVLAQSLQTPCSVTVRYNKARQSHC